LHLGGHRNITFGAVGVGGLGKGTGGFGKAAFLVVVEGGGLELRGGHD
jgi:hypothetical protein